MHRQHSIKLVGMHKDSSVTLSHFFVSIHVLLRVILQLAFLELAHLEMAFLDCEVILALTSLSLTTLYQKIEANY